MKSKGTSASATTAPAKTPAKRPGRPPTGSEPLTGAQRQAAYRRRQRDSEMAAYGRPKGQPTAAVVKGLGRLLVHLDDPERAAEHATLRHMAEGTVRELCARYKLKLSLSQ